MKLRNKIHKMKKFDHVLKGHLNKYRLSKMDWKPTGLGPRPTTDLLNSPEFECTEKMKVAKEGILSWFIVFGGSKLCKRPQLAGQRPTTDLLKEFWCNEENKSCSGGYPEYIHSGDDFDIHN